METQKKVNLKNLRNLSDQELEAQALFVVRQERKILHIVLEHIAEIDRRDLYLKSEPSLHQYLIRVLGYSSPAASARIQAYNLYLEVPELKEKIIDGAIHLTHIGTLSRAIKEKEAQTKTKLSALEKQDLVRKIEYSTTATSEVILCQQLNIKALHEEKLNHQEDGSVRITMTLTKEQYELLQEAKNLSAHKLQQEHKTHTVNNILEVALKSYIKSHEPKSKKKTMANTKITHSSSVTKTTAETKAAHIQATTPHPVPVVQSVKPEKIPKTITPRLRKEILARDGCCQHRDPATGKLCGSRFALQTDHRRSRWAGGTNEAKNLQALCANHNRYKYKKESGVLRQ